MNNFNWEEFKNGKVAVLCKTEELAKDFIRKCYQRNMNWHFETIEKTYYDYYDEKICYEYNCNERRLLHSDFEYFKDLNYKIIEWSKDGFTLQEVITNIKEGQSWENGLFKIICEDENKIKLMHEDLNECFIINTKENLFTLQQEEVPVLEAMEAFNKGKTIECVFKSANCEKTIRKTFIPQERNSIKEEDVITPYIIINGKWYIKG